MFAILGKIISRYWLLVILSWVALFMLLRPPDWLRTIGISYSGAPAWDDITLDGDFAYMPADMPSVVGEALMEKAFPIIRNKSEIVVVMAREEEGQELDLEDLRTADRLAIQFHNCHALAAIARARKAQDDATELDQAGQAAPVADFREQQDRLFVEARLALDEAVRLGNVLVEYYHNQRSEANNGHATTDYRVQLADAYRKLAQASFNRVSLEEMAPAAAAGVEVEESEESNESGEAFRRRIQRVIALLNEAISLDQKTVEVYGNRRTEATERQAQVHGAQVVKASQHLLADAHRRLADAFHFRAMIKDRQQDKTAAEDRQAESDHLALAMKYLAAIGELGSSDEYLTERNNVLRWTHLHEDNLPEHVSERARAVPLVGVWTRHTELVGEKLRSKNGQAQLIVLHLSNEFMAVDNVDLLLTVYEDLARMRRELEMYGPQGLVLGASGSTSVGGDMLLSAHESLRNTELLTITLVIVILVLVYRSPLLVAVPLATITLSFLVATSIVAALTQLHLLPGFGWWNFNVFTTTEIFILVIMFGAGTDYCLFLISRYREELAGGHEPGDAIARALSGVGDALAASALTTILGLLMMAFAAFGKYRNSGPAIAMCLVVSLLAAITIAPAILRALGKWVFWPFGIPPTTASGDKPSDDLQSVPGRFGFIWRWLAGKIVAYPGRILVIALVVMAPFAWHGRWVRVTYDLLGELAPSCPCRVGTDLLERHFPVGESGPVVVLARNDHGQFADEKSLSAIKDLTKVLYSLDDVKAVRSIAEPLGDPPKYTGMFDGRRVLRKHRLSHELFHAQAAELKGKVTRLELILEQDPFSIESIQVLNKIESTLADVTERPREFWQRTIGPEIDDELTAAELADRFESVFAGTEFSFTGTTAALRDLRKVTQSDAVRIKVLVVLAVFAVLLAILRRPIVCTYMVLSVLLSYYVTIGITQLFFSYLYADTFDGLDWKVPLFLFVILVAIGQDYNVYLATRVFEEQRVHGLREGLRRAVILTGGIITSCGVIMAGTLVSMSVGSLRTMVELGFALSLGVIIDTFIVRTVLLTAFLALLARFTPVPRMLPSPAPDDTL